MKPQFFKIIQILVSVCLLVFVFYQTGLFSSDGRERFTAILTGANIAILMISILVGLLINMSSAFKWYLLVRARQMKAGFWRIFSYYLVGQFSNLFLPTSVGGDVVRAYQLGKYCDNQTDAMASVFVERYTGVLVLLFIAGIAVLSRLTVFNVDFVITSLILFAVILGAMAWMLINDQFYQLVKRLISNRFTFTHKIFIKIDGLLIAINSYRNDPSAISWALLNSLIFYFLAVVNVYVTALVFQVDISFVDMLIATPIIMLIMNIPISVGNLGLMEFAYITILQMLGYGAELGLSVAILMRLKSLFDGVIGGVLYPIFVTNKVE